MDVLNLQGARHLSVRAGLGVSRIDVQRYKSLPKGKSTRHIVYSASSRWMLPPPKLSNWSVWHPNQSMTQKRMLHTRLNREKYALREWFIDNMLRTPHPLIERMVLFWHNHFTSSLNKVNQPNLLLKQNFLFRKYALGNFRVLLHEISQDPAMLIYLDNDSSKMEHPNENFARELLELYSLGEGNYTESDIGAAAQAFTGWTVDRKSKRFVFDKNLHDDSIKYFMGEKGRFNGNHIIDIILQKTQTAEHIATKLWYEFVSDEAPNPKVIKNWGSILYKADYDIRTLLTVILNSPEFWAKDNRNEKIKSPVELVVGTYRSLGIKPMNLRRIVNICDALGQKIMTPETPKGQPRGKHWIDSYTLPVRINLMSEITNKAQQYEIDRILNFTKNNRLDLLLVGKDKGYLQKDSFNRQELHALLTDPIYQLT